MDVREYHYFFAQGIKDMDLGAVQLDRFADRYRGVFAERVRVNAYVRVRIVIGCNTGTEVYLDRRCCACGAGVRITVSVGDHEVACAGYRWVEHSSARYTCACVSTPCRASACERKGCSVIANRAR